MALRNGLLALCLLATSALAVQPDEVLKDPVLEARARSLSSGLRCLVCQNQSIDESDAPLARDLRVLVRERLSAGESDAAVKAFVVARYGDFVLLRPPVNTRTLLLWASPLLILGLAGFGLWRMRRRVAETTVAALTPEEQARVEALVKRDGA